MNLFYAVIEVFRESLCALFARNFSNQILVICNKQRSNNLHDNDNKDQTFNQRHSSQLWLLNYSHKESNQLESVTSVYAGWFVAIWIQPFDLGGALDKHLDLPSPYATVACFLIRP